MTSRPFALMLVLVLAVLTPGAAAATPLIGGAGGVAFASASARLDRAPRRPRAAARHLRHRAVAGPPAVCRSHPAADRRVQPTLGPARCRSARPRGDRCALASAAPTRDVRLRCRRQRGAPSSTGRDRPITRRVRLAERLDAEVSGRRVRVLQRTRGGLELDEFGADGQRGHRHRFGLPAGVTPSFMGGSLRDGMVLVSTTTGAVAPYRHDLVLLGGAEHPIGLTGAVYRFVTPSYHRRCRGQSRQPRPSGAHGQP